MCVCISNIEKKLSEFFQEELPDKTDYSEPTLDHKALMGDDFSLQLFTYCSAKYKHGKQNKKWQKYVSFNYCPFCAEKYPK